MKKGLLLAALVALLFAFPTRADAHSYDSDDDIHPIRLVAYALHPLGVAIQDFVFRPFHRLVSMKGFSYWFGHDPRPDDEY